MIGYIIFIFAMAMAVICISYKSMARANGWPVGEILSKDVSSPKIVAIITALCVLGKSFMEFYWWSPVVILLVGWLVAFGLTIALKKNAQFLCMLGILPALVLTILYISEKSPFGFLHKLFG